MGGEVYLAESDPLNEIFMQKSLYRIAARLKHTRTSAAERF